jgi:hypothetical protein
MRRVAGPRESIADRDFRVRSILPGPSQHAGRPAHIALAGENAATNDGGGDEIWRQPMRLQCQIDGAGGVGLLQILRLRRQQHGAAAVEDAPVDVTVVARRDQGLQRTLPLAGAALHIEQRMDGPRQGRIELNRTGRILACRFHLAFAAGFEEQTPQAEQPRFRLFRHRLE